MYDFYYIIVSFVLFVIWVILLKSEDVLILSFALFVLIEMIMGFWSRILLRFIKLIFCMSNHPFIQRVNPTWLWYIVLLMLCWIQFVSTYFVEYFSSAYIKNIACIFFFNIVSLSGFAIRVVKASQNEFGSIPSSSVFWKCENWC